jgi:glycosyltransferase involved in cell wall biosynthesis
LELSVVIAAWNGQASLEKCLRSLLRDSLTETEVIVASNFDGETEAIVRDRFPDVRYVAMPAGTTVPRLRAEGIRYSTGEIVALAEDHCTFDRDWCAELKRAHQQPCSAIGGAVENASARRALDWAVYFYDYGKFMLPLSAGRTEALSGNNVSYKRTALQEVAAAFQEGVFEPFLHAELIRRGHSLYLAPSMIVYHQKLYYAGDATAKAYHLARSYAAKRVAGASLPKRSLFVVGSLLLPFLLPARIVLRTLRKRRLVLKLIRCSPYLLLLTASWAFGEFCGYLTGAGNSEIEWK